MIKKRTRLAGLFLLWAALGCAAPSGAQPAASDRLPDAGDPPKERAVEIEAGATRESLTNNLPDWRSLYLEASRTFRPRHTLYGGLRETSRFDLDDTEAYGGLYYPLSETWTGLVEASGSPSHNVLPKYSVFGQLHKALLKGLTVNLGLKHTDYTGSDVRMWVAGGEYYWSSLRAAYTFYSASLEGAGSAPAHRFQLNHYYGERSSIGIAYTTGRETENVGPPRGVITSDVRDWTITGRHWFANDWALAYDLLTHEQGTLYRRKGLRLGIRHRF